LRARCVAQALALSEFWRDRGEHVLLILDSATRYAMALREIGLSAGEPPTLRAYTPNVFAALPRVVERCGARRGGGAITAIMTILSETDDVDDPIVEVMKSLLDGHIILSRQLAEQGRFPAIDVPRSVSRLSERLMTQQQHACAKRAAAQLAAFEDARILIESGLYKTGGNAEIDSAMRNRDALAGFLGQPQDMETPMAESFRRLAAIMSAGGQT
jgi:flagellar biosynthesis/type III secretory pathway ATPase